MRLTTNIEGQAGREVGRRHSSAQHSALITIILNIYSLSKCSHWALMRCPARVDIFTAGTGVECRVPMASIYTPAAETQTQTSWCSRYAGPRQPRLSTVYWMMTTFWQLNATSSHPSTTTIISINIHNWRQHIFASTHKSEVGKLRVEKYIIITSLWTVRSY